MVFKDLEITAVKTGVNATQSIKFSWEKEDYIKEETEDSEYSANVDKFMEGRKDFKDWGAYQRENQEERAAKYNTTESQSQKEKEILEATRSAYEEFKKSERVSDYMRNMTSSEQMVPEEIRERLSRQNGMLPEYSHTETVGVLTDKEAQEQAKLTTKTSKRP